MTLAMQQLDTELKEIQCGTCGVWHAIPKAMFETCYEEGGFWYCPNGHCRGYQQGARARRSELEKERERRRWAEKAEQQRREELLQAKNQLKAQKAANTRMKNRAKAGTCPCCRRTFKQLAAHIKNKHPEFPDDVDEDS